MGVEKTLDHYLSKIPQSNNVKLLESFRGQNTCASYYFPDCGCVVESTLKLIGKFNNFEKCRNCRPRVDLDSYLSRIKYPVELIETFHGGRTKCKLLLPCGHYIFKTLDRSVIHKSNKCINCSNRKPLKEWIIKLPESVASTVEVVKYTNHQLLVSFSYNCGHRREFFVQDLLSLKNFDNCPDCQKKFTFESLLNKIPEAYRGLVTFDDINGCNTEVVYHNPCGHDSNVTIGDLSSRVQFDSCIHCFGRKSKLSAQDHLDKIPNVQAKIIFEDGRNSIVNFKCNKCCSESDITIGALLVTKGNSCRYCKPYNSLTNDDMVCNLSNFIHVDTLRHDDNSKYTGSRATLITGRCKACNNIVENDYFSLSRYYKQYGKQQCSACAPVNIIQQNLYEFVKSISKLALYDNRNTLKFESNKFKELDIYCPNEKFAVELNGLLWHSEKYKEDKKYHTKKTNACIEIGISLLHIWSDLYARKRDIYHSIIRTKLGKIPNRIFARKTKIKELSKEEIKDFFNKNHIYGNARCIGGWGLFYNNKLAQAISVNKVARKNKQYYGYLEVTRTATLTNHMVVGGESKLLTMVEKFARENKFLGIVSYISCEFDGIVKNRWKFVYSGNTEISYFYTNGKKRVSQKLSKMKDIPQRIYKVNTLPSMIYVLKF